MTRYAHLSRISVRVGDVLTSRQPIGVIGATGRATGAHLHYEIHVAGRAIDPIKFLHAEKDMFVKGAAAAAVGSDVFV